MEKAAALKARAKSQKIDVAHALIDDDPENKPRTNTKGLERTQQIWSILCSNTEHFTEPQGIRPAEGEDEVVFTRAPGFVSAMTSRKPYDINMWLAEEGYKSLILCGLSTGGCVMRTATSATDAGFVVTVVEDACFDKAEVHKVVAGDLLPMRANVFSLEDFTKRWEETA